MIANTLWLVAIVAVLLTVGCSDRFVAEELSGRGCHSTCGFCLNHEFVCADEYELTGGDKSDKAHIPGTPSVEVDVDIKK